ncbi:MAG TPA: sulfite exporter TauE/SafE family protein [Bacteroidales bacterium]|nr:sulfite exporter TauE/SafE family protein [Bacteroidales bacterium]
MKKQLFKNNTMNNLVFILGLLLLGIVAGYFSGLVGIGGGIIIVPALILLFGFSQHAAQGSTLALLIPPIGILAVISYFQKGYVDVKSAIIICIGFVVGGYLGGKMAITVSEEVLKKIFAVALIAVGVILFVTGK